MPYLLLFKRIFAQLIDLLLFYYGSHRYYDWVNSDNPMAYDRLFDGVGELFEFIPIWVVYSFVLEWITSGYSVGKWLMGLQVVKINGNSIGFREVFLRWLGNWFDFYLSGGTGAAIAVLVPPHRQRIGDYWAGTVVTEKNDRHFVKAKPTSSTPAKPPRWRFHQR